MTRPQAKGPRLTGGCISLGLLATFTTIDPTTGKPHTDTAAEVRDHYRIHDDADARAAVTRWFTERAACTN